MWLNYTFRKIHTANLASPSILCKLWCPLSQHSPVNKTGRFVTYQADFISDDATSNPSQSSRVTALRSSKRLGEALMPECLEPRRLRITTESKWVHACGSRDFKCQLFSCCRRALRAARQRRRGDKGAMTHLSQSQQRFPCNFPNQDNPKHIGMSSISSFPSLGSTLQMSDFQLH